MCLPVDGFIDQQSVELDECGYPADGGCVDHENFKSDMQCTSFVPTTPCQIKESDKVGQTLQAEAVTMEIGSEGYNEFSTYSLATMAFPCLFPDGNGDPTNVATVYSVVDNDTEAFARKLTHLIKFGEQIDGKWCYRFASHPRFGYWAYNMLFHRRLLKQGNFYIKNCENIPTIEELRAMAEHHGTPYLMNKLMLYAKKCHWDKFLLASTKE